MSAPDNAQSAAVNGVSPSPHDTKADEMEAPSSPVKPSPANSSPLSKQQEELITKVFQFLSTATPGTIGGIAVALAAITYFILGKIGLLLIGAFAGVTLFASWEARHPEVSRAVRGENGYDFLQRVFETKDVAASSKVAEDESQYEETLANSFDDFKPETRQALNEFVDAAIRDYVDYWYNPIVPPDKTFPNSSRKVLTTYLLNMANHLGRKRPVDAFIDFLTHTCSIFIVFLSEMTSAYASVPADANISAADAIYNYLASNDDSPLSNLLNQRQQAGKFKMVAEDLLSFLDRATYDCDPARVFLREIMSTIVLEGSLQTFSKAEWINGWIVYLLELGETDFSQAIDDAIDQKAFSDVDGNIGNINLGKGNRSSYEQDKARKKELSHKKKLSKADEEMEQALEEVKRLNEMIAKADVNKPETMKSAEEASGLLKDALKTTAKELDLGSAPSAVGILDKKPDLERAEISPTTRNASLETDPEKEAAVQSPMTPQSTVDISSQASSPHPKNETMSVSQFTNFDQIVPPAEEESEEADSRQRQPLTLHNASITIHDDAGNDKNKLRTKPAAEYLIQIEPAAAQQPGWMTMKTYTQFEALHESLRRIATISGANAFLEGHATFPNWRIHTKASLRGEIERYLRAACAEKPLAESEAMKRFVDKGQETRMGTNRGFNLESVGKGVLGAIQSAPKGAFDGGKVVVGGVSGVLGNIGLGGRKTTSNSLQESQMSSSVGSISSKPPTPAPLRTDSSSLNGSGRSRDSMDSQRSSVISAQPGKMPPMERRPSYQVDSEQDSLHPARPDRWERKSISATSSRVNSRASSIAARRSPMRSPSEASINLMKLPPPPDEITDDYESPTATRMSNGGYRRLSEHAIPSQPNFNTSSFSTPPRSLTSPLREQAAPLNGTRKPARQHAPLSEQETRVAVELLFAVINELYTLSSAWNIRRTLLTAAKSFLLRPGNPALASIKSLIQDTVIEANTSDAGLALHIKTLRANSMPTEEERAAWPAELTPEEKEELRIKARKLFIQSSVPAALMGIMGQSATNEALGRVFDCLQIEEVARGLFFGIMLQAARVVTH